ncbi:MAG: hypothetical protein WKF59_24615 [Chitinophagaceae bacterium]
MKNKKLLKWLISGLVITFVAHTYGTYAQVITKRLPDGTVVYSDGSVKLPNGEIRYPKTKGKRLPDGTVIYPDGSTKPRTNTGTRQQDGSIIYPDGRVKYPDGTVRYPDGTVRNSSNKNKNRKWLPPGQAKKIYGGKARDYAPGHNKNKKHEYDNDDHDKGGKNKDHGKRKNKHD